MNKSLVVLLITTCSPYLPLYGAAKIARPVTELSAAVHPPLPLSSSNDSNFDNASNQFFAGIDTIQSKMKPSSRITPHDAYWKLPSELNGYCFSASVTINNKPSLAIFLWDCNRREFVNIYRIREYNLLKKVYVSKSGKRLVIVIYKNNSPEKQRFTLAILPPDTVQDSSENIVSPPIT